MKRTLADDSDEFKMRLLILAHRAKLLDLLLWLLNKLNDGLTKLNSRR